MAKRIDWNSEERSALAKAFIQAIGPLGVAPRWPGLKEALDTAQMVLPLHRRRLIVSSNSYKIRDELLGLAEHNKFGYTPPPPPSVRPTPPGLEVRRVIVAPPAPRIPPTNNPFHPREPIPPTPQMPMSAVIRQAVRETLDDRLKDLADQVVLRVENRALQGSLEQRLAGLEKDVAALARGMTALLSALGVDLDASASAPVKSTPPAAQEPSESPLVAQGSDPVPSVKAFKAVTPARTTPVKTLLAFGLLDEQGHSLQESLGSEWDVSVSKTRKDLHHLGHYDLVVGVTKFMSEDERALLREKRGTQPLKFTAPAVAGSGLVSLVKEWEQSASATKSSK